MIPGPSGLIHNAIKPVIHVAELHKLPDNLLAEKALPVIHHVVGATIDKVQDGISKLKTPRDVFELKIHSNDDAHKVHHAVSHQ